MSFEFGGRVGSLYGDLVDEESGHYDAIGAQIRNADGNWLPMDPVVRGAGLELNAFLRHSEVVQVGLGLEISSYEIHPQDFDDDPFSRDFLDQQSLLFKIRALPFRFAPVQLGFEVDGGVSLGSVRRFGLALVDAPDSVRFAVRPSWRDYTLAANRPIDLHGTRLGFGPVLQIPFTDRFGLVAKGDFHWTLWLVDEDDPLNRYQIPPYPGYPKSLFARGADFAMLLFARF